MQKIIVYKTVKQWMVVGFVLLFSSFSINLAHLNKQHRLTKVFYKVKKKKCSLGAEYVPSLHHDT